MQGQTSSQQDQGTDSLLRFAVYPYQFCLPAIQVVAIIIPPRMTVLPMSGADIAGVFMYQGELATCIDLRRKFSLSPRQDKCSGQMLLGRVAQTLLAFWVDEVSDIVNSNTMTRHTLPVMQRHGQAFNACYLSDQDIILATSVEQLYNSDRVAVSACLQALVSEQVDTQLSKQISNAAHHQNGSPSGHSYHKESGERSDDSIAVDISTQGPTSGAPLTAGRDDALNSAVVTGMDALTSPEPVAASASETVASDADMNGQNTLAGDQAGIEGQESSRSPSASDDDDMQTATEPSSVQIAAVVAAEAGDDAETSALALDTQAAVIVKDSDASAVIITASADVPVSSAVAAAPVTDETGAVSSLHAAPLHIVDGEDAGPVLGRIDDIPVSENIDIVVPDLDSLDSEPAEPDAASVAQIKSEPVVVRVAPPADFIDPSLSDPALLTGAADFYASEASARVREGAGSVSSGSKLPWFLMLLLFVFAGYWLWPAAVDDKLAVESPSSVIADQRVGEGQVSPPEQTSAVSLTPEPEPRSLYEVLRIEDENMLLRVERETPAEMPAESQQEAITVVAAPAAMQDNDATAGVTDDSEDVLLQIADNVPAGDERPVGATDSPGLLTPDSGSAAELIIIQHTVVHGDTLWHIARKYLGNPYRYPHLAQLSRISNPNLIYPGDVVTIEYQDSDADTAR